MNTNDILNFVQISENIATSGELTGEQIKYISNQGYTTVINLTPHTAQDALPNEGKIVTANFMTYINIPVHYEDPQIDQLKIFCAVLAAISDQKVWVHCVRNNRVAAFMYLYQRYEQGLSHKQALSERFKQWTPDQTWLAFIEEAESYLYRPKTYAKDCHAQMV